MTILAIRHGLSKANDKRLAAFGRRDAILLPLGIEQAKDTGTVLVSKHGINPESEPVAASNMFRSQQTALVAGYTTVRTYSVLDEVNVPKTPELREAIDRNEIIPEAREAAEAVLASPPTEGIWFTHGYLIAALCELTEIDTGNLSFIPEFGEIRELPIEVSPGT